MVVESQTNHWTQDEVDQQLGGSFQTTAWVRAQLAEDVNVRPIVSVL
jgi:hypothetical protein